MVGAGRVGGRAGGAGDYGKVGRLQNCDRCGGKRWLSHVDKKTGLQHKHHITTADGVTFDLRVWKCWRCGHVQEEVRPFVPLYKRARANILYIDLEVSKSRVYNYGLRVPSTYMRPDDLDKPYFIICWSASYVGSQTIWSECVTPEEVLEWTNGDDVTPDKRILGRLQELMASADIVAGHNVDRFDIRRANARFKLTGLEPVIGKKSHDTLKIARSKFNFESNSLDYISQILGFRPKDDISNNDWLAIVRRGDEKTLKKVNKYCKGDVRNGKAVLEDLMRYSGKKEYYGSVTLEYPSSL